MHFANWSYAPVIISTGCAVLLLFLAYLVWKRHTLRALFPEERCRIQVVSGRPRAGMAGEVMIILSIILSTFVLLRPQWGDRVREVPSEGTDVLVVLDVSNSMMTRDAGGSRLDRARDAVRLLASSLEGDRMGLVLFAGDAFLQCPLTTDRGAFLMFLDAASPDSVRIQGSDLGRALDMARKVFTEKRLTAKRIVLITDGEDNEGRAMAAAEDFASMGVSIHALGVGSEEGDMVPAPEGDGGGTALRDSEGRTVFSRRNGPLLEKMAERTGGAYSDITSSLSGVSSLAADIRGEEGRSTGTRRIHEREDHYALFVVLLVFFLSAELVLPEGWERITDDIKNLILRLKEKFKGLKP